MSKIDPIPIPYNMWGGPDELYILDDLGTDRSVHLRFSARGDVVLATGEGVYVLDVTEFIDVASTINHHHSLRFAGPESEVEDV